MKNTYEIERLETIGKNIRFLRGEIRRTKDLDTGATDEEFEDMLFEQEYQLGEILRELGL